ncbi:MAG: DUF1573 domain-containing protein [Candidatus Binatia bacterium]
MRVFPIAAALAFGSFAVPVTAGPHGVPGMVVAEPVHDFGSIEQGDIVSHAFRLENGGTAPLRIENLKSSCGCTVALAGGHVIAPGAFGEVTIRLESGRLAGRTVKTVTVYTNDPASPSVGLTLTGQVVTDLIATPTPLYLGKVRRGEGIRREIRVAQGRAEGAHRVTWIEHGNPNIHATLEPVGEGVQRVVVEIDPRMPLGRVNDQLLLHTTSSRQPTLEILLFGSVEGDVVVLPPQVTFGVTHGDGAQRELHIRNDGARPVTVTRVEAPPAVASAELVEVEPGREYRVTLRLRDRLPAGRVEASLDIFTDHPDEAHLVVPIYAIVRADRG